MNEPGPKDAVAGGAKGVKGTEYQSNPDNLAFSVMYDRFGNEIARSSEDNPQKIVPKEDFDPRMISKFVLHFHDGSTLELPGMPLS